MTMALITMRLKIVLFPSTTKNTTKFILDAKQLFCLSISLQHEFDSERSIRTEHAVSLTDRYKFC